ncbi:Defensin-like protein [Dillenia turbinata]|uniref:Defensin-like protein n=1 Tax=Dillenia turbinata TaxID=194707 RepID=A0AAN8W3E6_9MAGN
MTKLFCDKPFLLILVLTGLTMVMVAHVDGKECTDWREDSGLCWEHYVCNVQCRALYRTGWGECLPHPQAERCLCRYQC